jgi:hypothetical protein
VLTLLTGKTIAHGLVTVPALLLARSEDGLSSGAILKVWRRMYQRGHAHSPKIAILTSSAFTYLAWRASQTTGGRVPMLLFGTAASLVTGIVPFTLVFMLPINDALMVRTAEKDISSDPPEKPEQKTTEEVLTRWAVLSGIRSLLPLAGGVLGLLAVLDC